MPRWAPEAAVLLLTTRNPFRCCCRPLALMSAEAAGGPALREGADPPQGWDRVLTDCDAQPDFASPGGQMSHTRNLVCNTVQNLANLPTTRPRSTELGCSPLLNCRSVQPDFISYTQLDGWRGSIVNILLTTMAHTKLFAHPFVCFNLPFPQTGDVLRKGLG